jgi:hypothetical protein
MEPDRAPDRLVFEERGRERGFIGEIERAAGAKTGNIA